MYQPLAVGILTLQCNYGKIGSLLDYGFNDYLQTGAKDVCSSSIVDSACAPNNESTLQDLIDLRDLSEDKTFFSWEYTIEDFFADGIVPDGCDYDPHAHDSNYMFVSYECVHDEDIQEDRYN